MKSKLHLINVWVSHKANDLIGTTQVWLKNIVYLTTFIYVPILFASHIYFLFIERNALLSVSAAISLFFIVYTNRMYRGL